MIRNLMAARWLLIIVAAFTSINATAHTLFLKPDSFFVSKGEHKEIPLINGTFEVSENKILVNRILDARIIAPDGDALKVGDEQWSYKGESTILRSNFKQAGNYVVGVGTTPMIARIAPENFNFYLRYEGLDDAIRERRELEETDIGAAERYQKFSKAILQVGDQQSASFSAILGYPVEIVPLSNPYELSSGDLFRARILKNGKPLADELVYATHEGHYEMSDEGIYEEFAKVRSDENGEIEFILEEAGRWYVRFIDLTRVGDKEHWYSDILVYFGAEEHRIPYRSLWATLTFEIR